MLPFYQGKLPYSGANNRYFSLSQTAFVVEAKKIERKLSIEQQRRFACRLFSSQW
jgi:primosomal protein N''